MTPGVSPLVLAILAAGDPFGGDAGVEPILVGCDSIADERVCRLVEKRTLKLFWRQTPDRSLSIRLDGERVTPPQRVAADGIQIVVDIPGGEHVLTAEVLHGWDEEFDRSWKIVDEDPDLAPFQQIVATNERDGVRLRRAFSRLKAHLRGNLGNPGRALRLLSRLAYRFQDREQSRELRLVALPWLLAAEEWSDLIELHHGFADSSDGPADKWEHLATAAELLPHHLTALPRHFMIKARLYEADGELRRARGAAELASIWAERLDQPRDAADGLLMLADFAAIQGRADEARQRIAEAAEIAPRIDACYPIRVDSDAGWIEYRLAEATGDATLLERAWTLFRRAERGLDTALCNNEAALANTRLNLALTALASSDGALADELLPAPEEAAELDASQWPWYVLARRHTELMNGEPGAEDAMAELAADVGILHEVRWLAALNLARSFVDVGRVVEAEEAFAAAGRLLDTWAIFRPNDRERTAAVVDVRAMESERVAFLLEQNRVALAGCVARRAQARRYETFVTGLSQRGDSAQLERYEALLAARADLEVALFDAKDGAERSRLQSMLATLQRRLLLAHDEILSSRGEMEERSCDTFRPSDADEVVLLYHPLGAGEWVAIALTDGAADHAWFDEADLRGGSFEWDEALLRPFEEFLAAKDRVRLIATGRVSQIPIHALILDADRSEEYRPEHAVAWTLDLPATQPSEVRRRTAAILIGNTDGLSHARKEAELFDATIRPWWHVSLVRTPDQLATALYDGGRLELLYAVGHATVEGVFQLDADRTLTADHIAALSIAPRVAIFSACHAALSATTSTDEASSTCPGERLEDLQLDRLPALMEVGVGAAQALLLAGTEILVAPQGALCDLDGWDLFSSTFADIAGSEHPDYIKIISNAQILLDHEVLHGWWRVRTILRG